MEGEGRFGTPPALSELLRVGTPTLRSLATVNNQHSVVGHPVARGQIHMRVIEGADADNIGLAHFLKEPCYCFIKMILSNFDVVGVPDCLDAELYAFLGCSFE